MSAQASRKTVFITGCSPGGIGNALAREFHARGCRVIASARRAEALADLSELGLETVLLDVDDEASVKHAVQAVAALTGGKLDILVNNAGTTYVMPLADVALPRLRALFETNLFAVIGLTNQLLPQLIAARGLVLNISSAAENMPFPFKGSYAMTKAALSSYSRTLSVEVAEFGVRVLNVTTAFISTQLGKKPEQQVDWPEDSLYSSMRELQQRAGGGQRMSAEAYAKQVVSEALRGKGWEIGPWRFFGTRETIMLGTMSNLVWVLNFLGNNWSRYMMHRMWKFSILGDALRKKNV